MKYITVVNNILDHGERYVLHLILSVAEACSVFLRVCWAAQSGLEEDVRLVNHFSPTGFHQMFNSTENICSLKFVSFVKDL